MALARCGCDKKGQVCVERILAFDIYVIFNTRPINQANNLLWYPNIGKSRKGFLKKESSFPTYNRSHIVWKR